MKIKIILLFFFLAVGLSAQQQIKLLNENWKFAQKDQSQWMRATVPGCVHTDLFDNSKIPHPFVGDNESRLQWIADKSWIYKTNFTLDKEQLKIQNTELVFEGLDTYAKVYLNEKLILETNNAFRTWKVDVKKHLKANNELKIEFTPTAEIEAIKQKENPYELPEGSRMFTRKAAFQYGWDWGPKYNTMGIWRDVYLNFWNDAKIEDVYIRQNSLTQEKAELTAEIELKKSKKGILKAEVYVNNQLKVEKEIGKTSQTTNLKIPLEINQPKYWWTHELGEAYLYEFKLQIKDLQGNLIDEQIIKKGLRTIELITDKDEFGESFYFKLNGVPVFMKGANYIPQNSFQNWVTKEDYDQLLDDVQKSNMNMLRIWGGGIYEEDYFYELCDEKGILIWQDFMFANGMYPGDEEFFNNVRQEAIDNVKRLRNHASIALWCGNNEISEGWHRWGWQDGRSEAEKAEIWENYQQLFNGILPEVVKAYSDLPYWESSPKFGRGDARYISEGDAHDWWIWHDGHPFEDLEKKTPRFMSEFGFQSFPSYEAIEFVNECNSTSIKTDAFHPHQKHTRGYEIIETYMERDFPVPTQDEDYVYMSQVLQAYGIGKGIEAQRRAKPYTMGSLYWQLNDCWPVVSWSSIDSFGYWKALHYQAQHSFSPVLLSFEQQESELNLYLVNDFLETLEGDIQIEISRFDGTKLKEFNIPIQAKENSNELVWFMYWIDYVDIQDEVFISAKLKTKSGEEFKNIYYLVKPKELKLENQTIESQLTDLGNGKYQLRLESKTLQKNVFLYSKGIKKFSNNFFDMLPNQSYIIEFQSPNRVIHLEDLKIRSMNVFINEKK